MERIRWHGVPMQGSWPQLFLIILGLLLVNPWPRSWPGRGCVTTNAQVEYEADTFMNSTEEQVKEIALKALDNQAQTCALVANCSRVLQECSRAACFPARVDFDNYRCVGVGINVPNCTGTNCTSVRADYTRSYVRAPALGEGQINAHVVSETWNAICAQRTLDDLFLSNNHTYRYNASDKTFHSFYLGTVDGSMRFYPGTAIPDCSGYDPRLRPWYVGAISVKKNLAVLIDVASSMANKIFVSEITAIDSAKNMTRQLLQTLTKGDRAIVMTYASNTSASPISSWPQYGPLLEDVANTSDSEFQALLNNVGSITTTQDASSDPAPAIQQALQYLNNTSTAQEELVKVIVLFTDGRNSAIKQGLDAQLARQLNNSGVALFWYEISINNTNMDVSTFVCSVKRGHHERLLSSDIQNPLYAMNSYFSFFARARNMSTLPYFWRKPYTDANFLGQVLTVAYAAISPTTGQLVGVAGIDIQTNSIDGGMLQRITDELDLNVARKTEPPTVPTTADLDLPNCTVDVPNDSSKGCAPSNADVSAVCQPTDNNHSYLERLCCPQCGGYQLPGRKPNLTALWVAIAVVGLSGIVGGSFVVWKKSTVAAFAPPRLKTSVSENAASPTPPYI